MNNARKYKIIS